MEQITSENMKLTCSECGNAIELSDELEVGEFFECEFCGIEYEVVAKTEGGELVVKIVEEEK